MVYMRWVCSVVRGYVDLSVAVDRDGEDVVFCATVLRCDVQCCAVLWVLKYC